MQQPAQHPGCAPHPWTAAAGDIVIPVLDQDHTQARRVYTHTCPHACTRSFGKCITMRSRNRLVGPAVAPLPGKRLLRGTYRDD